LIGELVAADHATSLIRELAAARTYNRAVRQALVVAVTQAGLGPFFYRYAKPGEL
jgi:hypothetical protein